jgi:hypothetical protein
MTRPLSRRSDAASDNPWNDGIAARSGSFAVLRLCKVLHIGNSGGSRAWLGDPALMGPLPKWPIDVATPMECGPRAPFVG